MTSLQSTQIAHRATTPTTSRFVPIVHTRTLSLNLMGVLLEKSEQKPGGSPAYHPALSSLLAASPAFSMPSFFPVDIFHLFGMNIPSQLWEVFINPKPGDPFSLSEAQQKRFARLLSESGKYLPGSFASGLPRDPTEFSKSHYKMFESSLVFHTFFPPFLHEVGAPEQVIEMISQLEGGVR
ncbi:unnamed protein product [Tilletia controversa]|uniref:Uncharacterized protein n=1 Tax=Tilletia controversa TaxID=13291 RepID=A0A8X7MUZ7_9BASI|nr:hypothetical protein A4X06_0g3788 [Tilletia controversa]CAD6923201.1 unnamed protein product [Tilletia controversa]